MFATAECEVESCAAINFGIGPHAASVFVDDALHDGQADAGAFKFFSAMQALEHSK
jgi:hypothetical protein